MKNTERSARMTRGDKIRSMTDEQIAEVLIEHNMDYGIDFCQNKEECNQDGPKDPETDCTRCLIEWLKQEVDEL